MRDSDFAADSARVVVGDVAADCLDPARFFANTYSTKELKNLQVEGSGRLCGAGGEAHGFDRALPRYA